jgi:phage host-nuclease inhibitor protein Gam
MAKAKKAVEIPADVDAVERILASLVQVRADRAVAEVSLEAAITEMREMVRPRLESLDALTACYEDQVKAFAKAHPDLFGNRRSVDLVHGRIGWREAASIKLKRAVELVVAALRQRRLTDAIVVTEGVNKDILATYDDETLAAIGAARVVKDHFYIDLPEPAASTARAE